MASAVPTQHDLIAESAAAVAAHKELLTTPCMVYDAINRRISPNPSYSRPRMMHMARVQSSFIGLIRNAHRLREERTPKELLFAVEQALIYAMASTAATTATHEVRTPMTYTSITNDAELQPHLVLLEHVLAHHDVASSSITAMGHLLANDVCYEALTTVLDHLLVRLTQEKLEDGRRSAEERKALAATLQNARDCKRCVEEMHTAYHTIDTPSQHQRRTPLTMIAPLPQQRAAMLHASTTASKLLMASYYGLLGCVTTLDPDRRALQGANVDARTSSSTSSSSISSSAMVEEYDPYSGKLVLARPLSSCRWGLSFNEAGFVVGVSNTLRTSTEAGERLFHALQLRATTGLRVREVQRRRIGGAKSSTSPLAEIINKMQSMADSDSLTLLLEKVPQPDLTSAHEVLFTMADQGNERSSGQHAVLVLQRFSTAVPWGCRFAMDAPSQQLHLVDCASSVRLCPAAKEFLFDFRNRLRVVQLNYRDVRQIDGMARVEDVVGSTVLLALGLQVLPATTTDEATMAVPPPPPPPTTTTATLDDVSSSSPAGLDDTDADVVRSEMFASAETTAAVDADPTLTAIDAASGELGDEVAHNHDEDARVAEDDVEDGVDAAQQAGAERDEMLPGSESAYGELDDLLKELDEAEELIQQHAQTDNVDASAAMKNIVHVEAEAEEEVDAAEPEVVPSPTADAIDAAVAAVAASTNAADGTDASPSLDAIDAAVAAAAASSCTTDATATQPLVQQPSTDMIDSIVQEILTKKKTMEEHKPRKKAGRPPKKAAATLAVEMDASTNNAAEDVPVLPPRASATELAMDEISTKKKDTSNNIADADDAVKNTKDGEEAAATADAVPRVSLAQLMEASPLHFTNSISANTFDGTTLEMSRPGVEHPWEMLIAFAGPDILLTRLPPLSTAGRTHPFTRYLNPDADGRGRWLIESINGEDLTLLNKKQKVATLELLKKCVNVRLALRGLPK